MKDYQKVIDSINYSISGLDQNSSPEGLEAIKKQIDFNFKFDFEELPELLFIYKFRETSNDYKEDVGKLIETLSEIKDFIEKIISITEINEEVKKIKEKFVDLLKESESFDIRDLDEDAYNLWEYEIKNILEENIFKIDFNPDFKRSQRIEYKKALPGEDKSDSIISVPHLEGRLYRQRTLILRIIKNLIKKGKDFIVSNNINGFKPLEGYLDIAEVCLNGHVINPNIKKIPNLRKPYCGECGEKTITECPKCKEPIPGRFIYKDFEDNAVWGPPSKFCNYCGSPYPWAEEAANEILNNTKVEEYDAFLSHAGEDKEVFANKLCKRLTNDGFKIWYDKGIKADQSIPGEINEGIKYSRNGIAIFSSSYSNSLYCIDEFNAMKHKSIKCKNFKLLTILHNFSLNVFEKEYPFYSHKRILFSEDGMENILNEIEPQLGQKNKSVEKESKEYKREEEYIKISTNEIIDYPEFIPERNHSRYNHSKKIIFENLRDIPLTITRIVVKTDFPIIENHFNSQAKIKLNIIEYEFNSIGEIEILLNQNPLILSPKDNISLILSLYTSTKVQYKEEYNFEYFIAINESSKKEKGAFKIKTLEIKK